MSDVVRLDLGTFVRPADETGAGRPRVEAVYGYLARTPAGLLLFDTGMGRGDDETEAWYRPRRVPIHVALAAVGVQTDEIALVVNCHLHFDHVGANPAFPERPVITQRTELETARAGGYTFDSLIDFPGARYEVLDGAAEIAPGVNILATPGHVDGHQSLALMCNDGTVVLAGQAHDTASAWSADALAAQARGLGHVDPLPDPSPWMQQVLDLDPRQVVFAHDAAAWSRPRHGSAGGSLLDRG